MFLSSAQWSTEHMHGGRLAQGAAAIRAASDLNSGILEAQQKKQDLESHEQGVKLALN